MKRFYDSIVDEAGNIVVGAEVYVRDNTSGDLVTIYSDNGSTATANPTLSGNDGYVSFWTADATLKLEIYIDGEPEKTITDYQHFDNLDNEIKALRSVTSAANKGFMFTGSGTGATYDLTAFALTILDDADAATVRTTIGAQPLDTDLTAIAALTSAADKGLQSTGAGTWALYDLTAAGKALLDDASATAQRTTLGLVIGTDVQAYDATLQPNEWTVNLTDNGDVYIAAVEAMTIGQGNAAIGTATLAYEKSTNAAPSTFSSTTLPATLEAGAWLKVNASSVDGFVAQHLVRTA